MRSVFSTVTFFYFVATAMASQPDKLKLYGVPRNAAAASLAVQKAKGKASIRGGNKEVSTQHKRSLQDWNTAFEAHVTMPIRLQSMMKKASGDANRRLQTVECYEQDNGLLACVWTDVP